VVDYTSKNDVMVYLECSLLRHGRFPSRLQRSSLNLTNGRKTYRVRYNLDLPIAVTSVCSWSPLSRLWVHTLSFFPARRSDLVSWALALWRSNNHEANAMHFMFARLLCLVKTVKMWVQGWCKNCASLKKVAIKKSMHTSGTVPSYPYFKRILGNSSHRLACA
jgi:hypothetical protein